MAKKIPDQSPKKINIQFHLKTTLKNKTEKIFSLLKSKTRNDQKSNTFQSPHNHVCLVIVIQSARKLLLLN